MLLDDLVLADPGGEAVGQQRASGSAADRVRPVQDHESQPLLSGGDHGVVHGPDVGVEAGTHVLDVEDHRLHSGVGEELRERGRRGAVRVVDRHAGPLVDVGLLGLAGLGGSAEAVLGAEDAGHRDASRGHGVHDADHGLGDHPGRVGDHADLLAAEVPPAPGGGHVRTGPDPSVPGAVGGGVASTEQRGGGQGAAADQQAPATDGRVHDHPLTSSARCRWDRAPWPGGPGR